MADKKISQLTAASQVNSDAVFPLSQIVSGSDATVKATVEQVGDYIADEQNFAGLNTSAKDLIGAINEIAAGGGGGGFTPAFSETKIVDNTTLASSFTFSQDYHNFDFIKIKLYNSSSTKYTTIITTPTTIDNIYTLTSLVNFNEVGNDQYVCYSQNSLTWSRSGRRNLDVYEIYGLDCTNATVTETQIYKAASMSSTWVDVTTQLNLFDFDWIMFASNDSSWDELQPCNDIYVPNRYTYDLFDESLRYYSFNDYGHAYVGTIGNHYLGALPFSYVAGIKFTQSS